MKNRIKELREQRGLTQEQLGELVGASRQAINAIETEKFEPSIWLAYIVLRASKEETMKRAIERSKLDRETNVELVETMWKQFSNLGIYEFDCPARRQTVCRGSRQTTCQSAPLPLPLAQLLLQSAHGT